MTQIAPIQDNTPSFAADALSFIPLGGCGDFGCNMSVYHCDGKFLVIDCGLGFPDERFPGVDTLLPDPSFLAQNNKDIVGMFITHAHEDHIGAVAALWPQLNCPIYATPLTAELLMHKLNEWNIAKRATVHVVPQEGTFSLGPFQLELINAAHSMPETSMVLIKTPHGNVLHTADWRLDDSPVEGATTNVERLQALSKENILAVIGDSTNATVEKAYPSESAIEQALVNLFRQAPSRVIVTSFSSHVSRIHNVAKAASKTGRFMALAGRSALRMNEAARKWGYLKDITPFLSDKEIATTSREKVVIFATGSQGEMGSALERLALDDHSTLSLEPGDLVIFSARTIPGNEKSVERVKNALLRRGIQLVTADQEFVHVSGHGTASEMRQLYAWVKPKAVLPVHGYEENLAAHCDLAEELQIKSVIPRNGDVIAIRESGIEKTGQVQAGLLAVDGTRVVPIRDSLAIKERHRVANEGNIVVTVVIDDEGYLLHDPVFSITGLNTDEGDMVEMEDMLIDDIDNAVNSASQEIRANPEAVRELVRLAIRRRIKEELGKRPLLNVHLIQLA